MWDKINFTKILALLFIVFVAIACGVDESIEQKDTIFDIQGKNGFVGTVDGTDAFIALLVAKKEALVYVCNGEEKIYEWFRGNIIDSENFSLTNSYNAKVDVKFDGSFMKGNVVLSDNTSHSFTAKPNTGNETGIFQVYGDLATQEGIVAGWIVNTKSEERGSFRLNSVFQATPQKPKTNTILFKSNSFSIQRFFVSWHPDSVSVIQTTR
jgi:hypothetical protein